MRDTHWDQFMKTGNIFSYLSYREEIAATHEANDGVDPVRTGDVADGSDYSYRNYTLGHSDGRIR